MTKNTNPKQRCVIEYTNSLVSVIEIWNFEFAWNLVLVIWFFAIRNTEIISKGLTQRYLSLSVGVIDIRSPVGKEVAHVVMPHLFERFSFQIGNDDPFIPAYFFFQYIAGWTDNQ